ACVADLRRDQRDPEAGDSPYAALTETMRRTLADAIEMLGRYYGRPPPPPTRDAFELVLLENVAYLASPEKRREAFELLCDTIGTKPAAILKAKPAALQRVTAKGILKATFARKLRECARVATEDLPTALDVVLDGPLPAARRALRRFP